MDDKHNISERAAAAKQAAATEAGKAKMAAIAGAGKAKATANAGYLRVKNITPEEKAKMKRGAGMMLTIASVVCPQGRVVRYATKGASAYAVASKAGVVGSKGSDGDAEDLEMETVTMELKASVPGGETMLFSAPGYVGEHAVEVPPGLKVGDTFTFDGDLPKEKTKQDQMKASAMAGKAALEKKVAGTKLGKQMEQAKMAADGLKMAQKMGVKPEHLSLIHI